MESALSLLYPALQLAPNRARVDEPLPLPVPGWGAREALRAVAEAAPELGLPAAEPVVVRALTTVVLRVADVAVKVYPPGTSAAHLDRQRNAMAGATTVHLPHLPAVVTRHGVVTATGWLPTAAEVGWEELGGLLRRYHDEQAAADLPRWTPLGRLASQVAGLPIEAAAVLMGARAELLAALSSVESTLGDGVLHGDVSPSNVMRAADGPRLIDLDSAGRGPLEYDLSGAARRFRSGDLSRAEYARFCAAYGHDVLTWPGLPLLDRIAQLDGVAFRLWDDRHRGRSLDWLDAELKEWRTPL